MVIMIVALCFTGAMMLPWFNYCTFVGKLRVSLPSLLWYFRVSMIALIRLIDTDTVEQGGTNNNKKMK